jgi:hypothetical protein
MLRLSALLLPIASLFAATAAAPPKIVLWSWYADEDLRFVKNDRDIGVAYLALTLRFHGQNNVIAEPRAIPLWLAPETWQMVVVRCDPDTRDGDETTAYSPRQRQLAARMIAEIVAVANGQAVQIDFDAPRSAYPFYRQLLADVRARLRPGVFLSMTALVSWCESPQSWLAGLAVDELVPMAFSMGRSTPAVATMLQRGGRFPFDGCKGSIGVQLGGEVHPRSSQRAYFFVQGQRWSPENVLSARREILP